MTKEQAIQKVKEKGAKVISCRMRYGKPQVTINWRDYPKVRRMNEVENAEILLSIR